MPRAGTLGNPTPYTYFGTFAGLPFWPGGLSLLAAAPGIGKTSWMLRMIFEAAGRCIPAALGCYEHTPQELKYRLWMQAEAVVAGAHAVAGESAIEKRLKRAMSYAELHLRLVFIVLGKPWAIYLLRETLKPKKTSQAVLLQTWLDVGELPRLIWGYFAPVFFRGGGAVWGAVDGPIK